MNKSVRDQTWQHMIQRCVNPNASRFEYYGGRGIAVCDRWLYGENGKSGRECFLEDMGPKPVGLSLDRWPDKDGPYEKSNCRWATPKEQANSRRQRRSPECWPGMITHEQIRGARAMLGLTQAELGERAGLSKTAITNIERGKSDAKGSTLRAIQRALEAAGAEFDADGRGVRLK